MEEVWKSVNSFDNYFVSNLGRIKSTKFKEERILKFSSTSSTNRKSYHVIFSRNNKLYTRQVSLVVAEAFLNHKSDAKQEIIVDHIDNNPFNNRVDNLQIISHRRNLIKEGRSKSGYPGVHWREKSKCWEVYITHKYKDIFLGCFKVKEEAAEVYNSVYNDLEKGNYDLDKIISDRNNRKLNNKKRRNEIKSV